MILENIQLNSFEKIVRKQFAKERLFEYYQVPLKRLWEPSYLGKAQKFSYMPPCVKRNPSSGFQLGVFICKSVVFFPADQPEDTCCICPFCLPTARS